MSNRTADLELTAATEAFCARLSAEGRSPATIAAYRRDLALVARVADELAPGIVCRAVTAGFLDQVFSAGAVIESERGPRSAASLHRMKAAVRAFFAWAVEAGVVNDNPARSIRMHRLPRKLPVFLTASEKKRLLKELKGRPDFSALRDRAMIEVLLGTGIRLGELAALDMDDIDPTPSICGCGPRGMCRRSSSSRPTSAHCCAVTWPSVVDTAARKWKPCSCRTGTADSASGR